MNYNYMRPSKMAELQESFNKRYYEQIRCAEFIQKTVKDVISVMNQFNGKIINKKLIDAINEVLAKKYPITKFGNNYSFKVNFDKYQYGNREHRIAFSSYMISTNNDCDTFYLVIPDLIERLNMNSEWQKTNIEKLQNEIDNYINTRKAAIKQYKSFYNKAARLEEKIYQFDKEFPYILRLAYGCVQFKVQYNDHWQI